MGNLAVEFLGFRVSAQNTLGRQVFTSVASSGWKYDNISSIARGQLYILYKRTRTETRTVETTTRETQQTMQICIYADVIAAQPRAR